jgi:cytochrome bd ubiquinol oxidase subunit I
MLEATFFGVMLLGRDRTPPWLYFLSCCMVSLGTMLCGDFPSDGLMQ